ncbi:hypothetical protein F7725_007661 [Dissostichus mawsoni]|uniref:Uncharacterized protein n=1 Tax=Dissostichus mawsoni TaxID=36200 RepID=A0A7J5Y832_DISMA|nr:hypothetical protein F7725_007661 [Dissostichus mawsoni]
MEFQCTLTHTHSYRDQSREPASTTSGSLWSRADGCRPSSRTSTHTIGGLRVHAEGWWPSSGDPYTTGHHRTGFRRGRLAEQLALPAGLCGLALTAAGLAAGPTSTPSEDWGPAPRAKSTAAENHASPAGCTQGRLAKQLARPEDLCGLAPAAAGLASGPTYIPLSGETPHLTCGPRLRINDTPVPVPPVQGDLYDTIRQVCGSERAIVC